MEVSDLRVAVAQRILTADMRTLLKVGEFLDGFGVAPVQFSPLTHAPQGFVVADVQRVYKCSYQSAWKHIERAVKRNTVKRISRGRYETVSSISQGNLPLPVPHKCGTDAGQLVISGVVPDAAKAVGDGK